MPRVHDRRRHGLGSPHHPPDAGQSGVGIAPRAADPHFGAQSVPGPGDPVLPERRSLLLAPIARYPNPPRRPQRAALRSGSSRAARIW